MREKRLNRKPNTSTTTSLLHLKSLLPPKIIIFWFLRIKFYEKQVHWLTNYNHYLSNSPPHPFLFTHLNQPLKYSTLLQYSVHIPNTHKKIHARVVHRRPNIHSHNVLFCHKPSCSSYVNDYVHRHVSIENTTILHMKLYGYSRPQSHSA